MLKWVEIASSKRLFMEGLNERVTLEQTAKEQIPKSRSCVYRGRKTVSGIGNGKCKVAEVSCWYV